MAEIRVKETGTIKLFENDNTSSVTIASPASLGADRTITLPDASVTLASGTMLATDGDGSSLTGLPDNTPAFQADFGDSSGTSVPYDTYTKMLFDNEQFDTDGCYDNSTNYRFTPTTAGYYFVYARICLSSSSDLTDKYWICAIRKNGANIGVGNNPNSYYTTASASTTVYMNGSSDYLECAGYTTAAGGIGTESPTEYSFFGAFRLI
jgi:hypothetical protein